ncbi:Ribosome 60S biogenesis N-terminal family protein [Clavispora lusitaniae]|uniref:Ribosome 60S biogenesis N-terminal family protein n=1 Tax=Clavispora lusitaniae TaxID=36911 RepID=UPI0016A11661|nr:hypothetical protein E0198_005054 [Clavispora lusitaniae]KAF7580635.1 Ribosome 60S biogenesis N-terminal family protein [Clavispora lusitaniae]
MSSKTKKNVYSSANVDSAALKELLEVSHVGVFDDLTPVVSFVQKGLLLKTLSNISYFSSVNSIKQVARVSDNLAQVLDSINFVLNDTNPESKNLQFKLALLDQRERLSEFYSDLCKNHLKLVYKVYGLRKPEAVAGVSRLVVALCEYNDQSVFSEFLDSFDFNHTVLPKIFVPSRDDFDRKVLLAGSMRSSAVDLWLAICSKCPATFRKALLTNFKIMNNFWKYVEMERYDTLNKIIEFLTKYVLDEKSFKRSTKCQILNENFLFNFRSLFPLATSENTRLEDNDEDEFSDFKSAFTTFMNVLVSDSARGISYPQNEFGSLLTVNNKSFKINNKLIYTLLTALKPWESYSQLQYVMEILNHNSELLPPYMNWIVAFSGGYHDPSLTSYWIGHTLLYTEILKSPSLPAQLEYVSLAPLSKNAMTDCLTFPNDLVKQLGLQLILLQLLKLSKANNVPQTLVELVLENLPVNAMFVPLLNHPNNTIKLTATMIVRTMEQLAPASSSSAIVSLIGTNLAGLNLENDQCDSFELILLDNYLSIQSNNDLKWWNKSSKGNSFFTSLLKLSSMVSLKSKLFHILEKLTKTSLIFHDMKYVENPLLMLIEATSSFKSTDLSDSFWNCMDETISRSIKTPYKYLDKSHLEYDDVSIFVVVLFEQLRFVPQVEADKSIMLWLNTFMQKLVVVGESLTSIEKLAGDNGFSLSIDLSSVQAKDNIITKYDFAEGVLVLNRLVNTTKSATALFDLVSKLGSFLMGAGLSDTFLYHFVSNPEKWPFVQRMSSSNISENDIIGISLFSELLQQLEEPFFSTPLNKLVFESCKLELPKKNQAVVGKFLWILSGDQIKELANEVFFNELLITNLYKKVIDMKLDIVPDFAKLMAISSQEMNGILSHFKPPIEQIHLVLGNPHFHFLLDDPNDDVIQYLIQVKDISDDVLYRVAIYSRELAEKYKGRVISLAMSLDNWSQSMKIFTFLSDFFEINDVLGLVMSHVEGKQKLTMTADFARFLTKAFVSGELPETVKIWFHKAMVYITKKFAESPTLSENFDAFLQSMEGFISSVEKPWKLIPSSVVNTQFEVLLKHHVWAAQEKYLSYANKVILKAEAKDILSDKLLQIFVNNEHNVLNKLPNTDDAGVRFNSALLIYTLFNLDASRSATITLLNRLLTFYLGSTRCEDLLIKVVLKGIEKNITQSWVNQVTNWDFSEEISQKDLELVGEERLFIRDHSNLVVALNKKFVQNTVNNMADLPIAPKTRDYTDYERFAQSCPVSAYQETVYDAEFLILVIINNDELIREEEEGKITFNMAKLADSGLLGFVVAALSNAEIRDISKILLHGMLKYINASEANFKDKSVLKVYVSSILHTLRVADHKTPLVWHIVGSMASILTNPGHFLYDRVVRYILATPVFKELEIPLFNTIMFSIRGDDTAEDDNYYRQVSWILEQLTHGVQNGTDLKLLRYKNVVELMLNMCNSSYVSSHMKSAVLHLLYVIQRIQKEGSDMLVTKFGALSSLEILKSSVDTGVLAGLQSALNADQVALRFGVLASGSKRLQEWTSDDVQVAVKRIHAA